MSTFEQANGTEIDYDGKDESMNEDKLPRGQICRVCETKMYIKTFHGQLDTKIQKLDKQIRSEKYEMKNLQNKRQVLRNEVQNVKDEIDRQNEEYEADLNNKK